MVNRKVYFMIAMLRMYNRFVSWELLGSYEIWHLSGLVRMSLDHTIALTVRFYISLVLSSEV